MVPFWTQTGADDERKEMVISIPIAGEPGGLHDQAVSREVANGKGLLWPPVAMLGGPGNGGKWRITKISNMADAVGFCFS